MSHVAIAAALALEDVSAGERLVAFSLASFANREQRAWPGTRVAAVRAGLSRSQYLAARERLRERGLIAIEEAGGGRGQSPTVALTFARTGPWCEREINAPLFEAVLAYSATRGPVRLLLAALAAFADQAGVVADVATDELRTAAGMADSTYRRARAGMLANGAVTLETPGGGRARTNQWIVHDPRAGNAQPATAPRTRVAPNPTARPLIATVCEPACVDAVRGPSTLGDHAAKGPGSSGVSAENPGQDRTVYRRKGPGLSGVSVRNPAQGRTDSRETPPQTPPETPPFNARAGSEPHNPQTGPPNPPDGGSSDGSIAIVEDYVSDRGRRRQRVRVVDRDKIRSQLRPPGDTDLADWQQIRGELRRVVGDSTFAIWLEQLQLRATDQTGALLISAPPATRRWVHSRFGGLLERIGAVGRSLRFAEDSELQLLDPISSAWPAVDASSLSPALTSHDHKEAV